MKFRVAKAGTLFNSTQNEERYIINNFQNGNVTEKAVSKEEWQHSLIQEEMAQSDQVRKTKQCFWFQKDEITRAEFYYDSEKGNQIYEFIGSASTFWEEDIPEGESWMEGQFHNSNEMATIKALKKMGFQMIQKYIEYDRTYWNEEEIIEQSYRKYYLYAPKYNLEAVISNG